MDSVINIRTVREQIENTNRRLLEYCHRQDWAGFDPYDVLNSRLLASVRPLNTRMTRIALTQLVKRLPVNLRPLLRVSRELNPKAMALFLMAHVKHSHLEPFVQRDFIKLMVEMLVSLRSRYSSYWCWGYSFPWQTRTILVPRAAPNLVCTTFVANALLDAYETNHDERCLSMAVNAGEYILNELYWTTDNFIAGFCYPLPSSRVQVHNANFLGAALFCRIYKHTGERKFLESALKVARYSVSKQNADGSWPYGDKAEYRWIDNFHTGYNLCALRAICRYTGITEFDSCIRKGFGFYRSHFFREDGAPRYYHDRTYPIDIHCVAQSIITLVCMKDLDRNNVDLARSVYRWAISNMWDDEGYFYYQIHPFYKNKISYMRWSQAWMVLAIATLLNEYDQERADAIGGETFGM